MEPRLTATCHIESHSALEVIFVMRCAI